MRPNTEYIKKLQEARGWSNGQLALKMGVSRATVGRVLSEKRGGGKTVIAGIIRAFPKEPLNKLFIIE